MYSGLFTGDSDPSDQGMFIDEQEAFKHLCERPCSSHYSGAPWKLDRSMRVLPHTVTYVTVSGKTQHVANFMKF